VTTCVVAPQVERERMVRHRDASSRPGAGTCEVKVGPPRVGTPPTGRMPIVQRVLRAPLFWIAVAAVAVVAVILVFTVGGDSGGGGVGY
jgi:hypothetical protein